jgi:hypothetical protein
MRDRLWPTTFVTEWALASVVAEVRAALQEDSKAPRFVRTVHRVGYAFCGEARESTEWSPVEAATICWLQLEGREVALRSGAHVLGRIADGVTRIDSSSVSRRHALIVIEDGAVTLKDLDSKNGTFLRGQRISAPTPLVDGDEFRLGRVRVTLKAARDGATTGTDVE